MTVTGVRLQYCALFTLLGLWSGLIGFVTEYYNFKYVHPMRQIAETQKLSAATGAFGYKHSNVLSGLQHLRTHEYDGQPPVDVVDWLDESG